MGTARSALDRRAILRIGVLGAALIAAVPYAQQVFGHAPGCDAYIPSAAPLIAHAGGGLPDRTYANNRAALDMAASHGFTLIELDFLEVDGKLVLGHDTWRISDLSVAELMAWLDAHPGIAIVTDFKTGNVAGLTRLKEAAGPRTVRFIPQIYSPDEYAPVAALGYPAPILTIYRIGDSGWQQAANSLPLRAVTMPFDRRALAAGLNKPVFLHTVNEPIAGYGLYTDCLIPQSASQTGGKPI